MSRSLDTLLNEVLTNVRQNKVIPINIAKKLRALEPEIEQAFQFHGAEPAHVILRKDIIRLIWAYIEQTPKNKKVDLPVLVADAIRTYDKYLSGTGGLETAQSAFHTAYDLEIKKLHS